MSSSDSETSISTSSPIPKLIKHIRYSFLGRDFDEVQNILIRRENAMKMEIESLRGDPDSASREKFNELKKKFSESERLRRAFMERCNCLDMKVAELGQEMVDLRHEKLAAVRALDELKRQNAELRVKKMESDEAAEFNKTRFENLASRITKMEKLLADRLNVKVGDIAMLVSEVGKLSAPEGGNLNFPEFRGRKDSLDNCSAPDDARVRSITNHTESKCIGSTNQGDRNVAVSSTRDDGTHTVQTSPKVESNECQERQRSGAHASGTRIISEEGCSGKIAHSSSAAGDTVVILDSDDETNPAGATNSSDRGECANVGENETNFQKFVESPFSNQRSKRNRTDQGEDLNLVTKRTRNVCTSDADNVSVDTQFRLQNSNGLNDEDSSDSDESCSDSTMNELIASLRGP